MKKETLVSEFLKEIPEIKDQFEKTCNEYNFDNDTGIYVVWGLGIMPHVLDLLRKPYEDQNLLEKIFDFFEKMCFEEDDIRDVLLYSTLEILGDDIIILDKSRKFMKKETKQCSELVESFLGR